MRTLMKFAVVLVLIAFVAVGASAALDAPSRTVSTTTLVEAPREDVWRILTDFDGYVDWNPYMRVAADGRAVGSSLGVVLEPDGGRHELHATIHVFNAPRKLRWQSRLLVPGLMDVEYEVIVAPVTPRLTRVIQRAREEGIVIPVTGSLPTREGLAIMAAALERKAEVEA